MIAFKILWGVDALATIVILGFFFAGLSDNTVSTQNIGIWLIILAILAVIMIGSILLKTKGLISLAYALLLCLTVPALLFLIFMLFAIFGNQRWN